MIFRASSQQEAEIRLPADINWHMLDKSKFFVIGAGLFSGVSAMLYPVFVLKTQQQVLAERRASISLAKEILQREGIRGLYKGFGTSLLGTIPARAFYMSTLEITKCVVAPQASRLGLSEPATATVANALAGLNAAVAAQTVWTPVDVISQRLMVQGANRDDVSRYKGGVDAFKQILRADGLRGLYRGFGMSIITYAPSNALWWASYCMTQRSLWWNLGYLGSNNTYEFTPNWGLMIGVQGFSAVCAGGVAALFTTPLDTIKTRLQVLDGNRPTITQTLKVLVTEGGWKACYKGLGPRWAGMSLSATTMIITYEFLKRVSAKPSGCG